MEENCIYLENCKEVFDTYMHKKNYKMRFLWKKQNCSHVKAGQIVLEGTLIYKGKVVQKYALKAPSDGILIKYVGKTSFTIESDYCKQKLVLWTYGEIFKEPTDYISSILAFNFKTYKDEFGGGKNIRCNNILYSERNAIYKRMSSNCQINKTCIFKICDFDFINYEKEVQFSRKVLGVSITYEDGKCNLEVGWDTSNLKLKKGDSVSFMFGNGDILDFKAETRPYKKNEEDAYRYFKCQLYANEIKTLQEQTLLKWRISFNNENRPPITMNVLSSLSLYVPLDGTLTAYAFKKYVDDFIEILKTNFPKYNSPSKITPDTVLPNEQAFNWCYVYLMKDFSNGYYKIGMSNKPEYRERTLQSEKPTIEMIANKRYPSRKIAEAIEAALHNAFSEKRIRGEWFSLDAIDVELLLETLK